MRRFICLIIVLCVFMSSCNLEKKSQTLEVTRIVGKEVTREVVKKPTGTVAIENSPGVIFSMNYLGELEQDGIKVELARVIFMHRDALKPDVSFDDVSKFDGDEYVGEIIWRITNNTQKSIKWGYDGISVRVNDRQYQLENYSYNAFGEAPDNPIFSGSVIIGGIWFGIGRMKPDEIVSVTLLMGKPYDTDSYKNFSSNFIVTGDLSGEHQWYPIPDELK